MAQQRPEDIMQFYKEFESDAKDNQLFKCECCRQESKPDLIIDRVGMIYHLYERHHKSEIMNDQKYKSVATSFYLSRQYQNRTDVGKCLKSNCDAIIKSKFGIALPFQNHLITHHADDKKNFFAKAVGINSGQKILDNYEIKDTEIAKCSFCQEPLSLQGLDSDPAKVLTDLSRHLIPHVQYQMRYSNEIPVLDEASIQIELEEEEKMHQEMNEKKQNIDEERVMEETLNTIEMEAVSEELNTLLQRYTMVLNKKDSKVHCKIKKCQSSFKLIKNKIYHIRNHWEIHHGPKNKIYNEVKNHKTIQTILQKYKITDGNLATCPDCQYSKNLEEDTQLSFDTLCDISEHWKLHNVDNNCKRRKRNLQRLQNLREKRREAATQISHQAERPEQRSSSDDENIPGFSGIPGTSTQSSSTVEDRPRQSSSSDDENIPGFSGIPGTSTQSSSTVEDRPRQSSSNDEEDVPVSGGMQSTMTQNFSTEESSSKRRRLDSDSDVE